MNPINKHQTQDGVEAASPQQRRPKFGGLTMLGLACVGAAFVGLFVFFVVYGTVASN